MRLIHQHGAPHVWILEIPQEEAVVFATFEGLKTWVAESPDCPVEDYFGRPVKWVQGEVTDDWYAAYKAHAHHTEYMYARKAKVN